MENTIHDWFTITDTAQLDTPALIVYPERVKHNLELLKTMIDDVSRLRPHIKTHKCREVVLLAIKAGIQKFKCATIAEAEILGTCRAPDVLLAYQPVGPKIGRLINLIQNYSNTNFSCLVDNVNSVTDISSAMSKANLLVNVYLDINVGMNRTGIKPGLEALQLYMDCQILKGVNPLGLHIYDGHIHDTDINLRSARCNAAFSAAEKLQQELKQKGYPGTTIIAGGTPTFPIHAKRKNIECSPGTFVYWDWGYGTTFTEQLFLPAALVLSRIVSQPDKTKLCLDTGHKSVGAENSLNKRIHFLNAPELKIISQNEEHLVVEAREGHNYKIGDILYGLPYHICPTVALYEKATTVENNQISGRWLTLARDREITT